MTIPRLSLSLSLVLALAACAPARSSTAAASPDPAPAAQANVDPVGRYRYTSTGIGGHPLEGTITITGAPGAYTGVMTTGISPDLDLREITVTGRNVAMATQLPQGRGTIELTLDGDRLEGRWSLAGMSAPLTGTRLP